MYIINGVIYADLPAGSAPQIINGVIYGIEEVFADTLVPCDSGSYLLAGDVVELIKTYSLSAEEGSYNLTSPDVSLLREYTLTNDTGTFNLTGLDTNILYKRFLSAEQGTFSSTGFDTALTKTYSLLAGQENYILSGFDVNLEHLEQISKLKENDMRYTVDENPYIWAKFNKGDTPSIVIYDASDSSIVVSGTMTELLSTGHFKYLFNPTPIDLTNYYYIAETASDESYGDLIIGGYPNEILEDTERISYLTSGTAATNVISDGFELITGTETNTYAETTKLDGILHTIVPVGGNMDFYYKFNVGANGSPVSIRWEGFANAKGDTYVMYAWNWVNNEWDEIGSFIGINGADIILTVFSLTIAHVGTSTNQGEVRARCTSINGSSVSTDRILCSYATLYQSVGYSAGRIWVDTHVDNENTVNYIDGVADNPVSTVSAALTLSSQLGIKSFHVNNGSDIVLSSASDNFTTDGFEWHLDLNGQSCGHASFTGANVMGSCVGTHSVFRDCSLAVSGTMTAEDMGAYDCALSGDIVINSSGDFYLEDCFSNMPSTGIPSIDFGTAGGVSVKMRGYRGAIEIRNMSATDNLSLDGAGQLIINANCSGGPILIRGCFTLIDNVIGGFVAGGGIINDNARYDQTQISDAVENSIIEGSLTDIEMRRIMFSALAGLASGGSTASIKFRDLVDSKDRISVIVDTEGNRTSITLDGS